MADPYVGEIRLFGFPRIPDGWLACDGTELPIPNYDVLFMLLGTTFGGDGVNTFSLPDLRGRVPISQGNGRGLTPRLIGERAGEEGHTLSIQEIPFHGHSLVATTTTGTTATPGPAVQFATASLSAAKLYAPLGRVPNYDTMAPSISSTGDNLAHNNMMPTVTCNYCICYLGVFPSQN